MTENTVNPNLPDDRVERRRSTILSDLAAELEEAHPLIKELHSYRIELKQMKREVHQNVRSIKSTLDEAMQAMLTLTADVTTLERDLTRLKRREAMRNVVRVTGRSSQHNSEMGSRPPSQGTHLSRPTSSQSQEVADSDGTRGGSVSPDILARKAGVPNPQEELTGFLMEETGLLEVQFEEWAGEVDSAIAILKE
mmetsp:Transcript_30661/g.66933  ORF Transcript_30661/g.66933 Transcript_30661/m.66933 type:complete len:195 (-) Transcript_30661:375-959(-)|eukprot:CAMPEP_0118924798 /NCGR_PEP_ID=MMETSP1169-20130426/2765_1 /TAXON_ID=36882 /ORGANISM="Pyramimonas obovata, Strain CCMP722" /LENGTH=194 /DNA_ID=CAMNT_0006865931 /DNA_START=235 /DNA_END=819 /DNA_ORIENTATION=+